MNLFKLASLVAIISFTTACSGGGGGGTAETPDSTKIDLTNSPKGAVEAKTNYGKLIGHNNHDSFYGVWRDDARTQKQLRYQGTKTANSEIPKAGKATYKGDAVWISGLTEGFQKGGVTTLNVDFDRQSVDGSIKFSVFNGDEFRRDITLHTGKLSGAEFSGNASVLGNSNGRYEGALFGKGAKEAAGLVQFTNNSDLDVSFGGIRQ